MVYAHNEISIIQKSYNLYKLTYDYAKKFPKSDKYSLGEKIKNLLLEILELLIEAETAKRDWKQPVLEKASRKLNLLKILLRLANDIKILDDKKYLTAQDQVQEIGRMLGGWIKAMR